MKILVIQLARFGDILQSWPTVRALKRKFPQAEVHLLVRHKFVGALEGLEAVDRKWILDTAKVLEGFEQDVVMRRFDEFCQSLTTQKFDMVINLSFSPFSSYLTKIVSTPSTQVRGYSRTSDGFLALPDDCSAYFYAQVGIGGANRFHLSDVFAEVAGAPLAPEDWRKPAYEKKSSTQLREYILIHPFASQSSKSIPTTKLRQMLIHLLEEWRGQVVLIGSEEDLKKSQSSLIRHQRLINLMGSTSINDLFSIVDGASLCIAVDSLALHIASLTDTPCLNVSFPSVNFWETGPKSSQSRILWFEFPEIISAHRIVEESLRIVEKREPAGPCMIRESSLDEGYRHWSIPDDKWAWSVIRALYIGENFPQCEEGQLLSIVRIWESIDLGLRQLEYLKADPASKTHMKILDEVDNLLAVIAKQDRKLAPFVKWFFTEKVRVGPGNWEQVLKNTTEAFEKASTVLSYWISVNTPLENYEGKSYADHTAG